MHTAPPLPPFIHSLQDSPQPPLATPDQLRDAGAVASHVPDEGLPNCWNIGAGADAKADPDDDPPLVSRREPSLPAVHGPPACTVKGTNEGLRTTVKDPWDPVEIISGLGSMAGPAAIIVAPVLLIRRTVPPAAADTELGVAVTVLPEQVTVTSTGDADAGAPPRVDPVIASAKSIGVIRRRMEAFL